MPDNLGGMNTDIGQLHYILHQSGIALDRLMGDELLQDMLSMASNYIDKGQRMNVVLAQLEEIFGRKLPRYRVTSFFCIFSLTCLFFFQLGL